MEDLIAFLQARYAEDARELGDAQSISGMQWVVGTMQGTTVMMSAFRFRAELDAKRRRLELLADAIHRGHDDYDIATELLPLEALPYASHPDYQDTWRP